MMTEVFFFGLETKQRSLFTLRTLFTLAALGCFFFFCALPSSAVELTLLVVVLAALGVAGISLVSAFSVVLIVEFAPELKHKNTVCISILSRFWKNKVTHTVGLYIRRLYYFVTYRESYVDFCVVIF